MFLLHHPKRVNDGAERSCRHLPTFRCSDNHFLDVRKQEVFLLVEVRKQWQGQVLKRLQATGSSARSGPAAADRDRSRRVMSGIARLT